MASLVSSGKGNKVKGLFLTREKLYQVIPWSGSPTHLFLSKVIFMADGEPDSSQTLLGAPAEGGGRSKSKSTFQKIKDDVGRDLGPGGLSW